MSSFLQEYHRQPKLYIDLPSQGHYYKDVMKDDQHSSVPVFGMNAMDEITFKTPDALLTGTATANVMQSCIPHIKDPWSIVGYDIDYILIAIRIATYGETMPISTACPHCSAVTESDVMLPKILENFAHCPVTNSFDLDGFKINLKPLTYRENTDFSMQNFSLERNILAINNNDQLSREEKENKLQEIFVQSSNLNLTVAVSHIESIEKNMQTETDATSILDFIQKNDAVFYQKLRESIQDLTQKWNLPNIDVKCASEDCGKTYKTKLNLDYSNFFGTRSLSSRNLI